jgi:HprK-related kinase A
MILADLPLNRVKKRLAGEGLLLQTGRFTSLINTPIGGRFLRDFYALYQNNPVYDNAYVDFNFALIPHTGLRRFFRPKVSFDHCGVRPFQPLPLLQAMPLFEWAMNWCVSQHNNQSLIIHAAVVEKNDQVVILPGLPGSGKSTLCAALVNLAGWRLLSDELTLIELSTGLILPNPRPMSLKNGSIALIRSLCPDVYCSSIVKDTVKGSVALLAPPLESIRRVHEAALASFVVFPNYKAGAHFSLTQMSKGKAFIELANHSFNYSTLGEAGFSAIARQMDTLACFELIYDGNLPEAVKQINLLISG